MAEISFIYEGGEKIIIQSNNLEEKIKNLINKFKNKIKDEDNNLSYIYNGDKISEELALNKIIKDNDEKKINILVYNNKNKEKEIISN